MAQYPYMFGISSFTWNQEATRKIGKLEIIYFTDKWLLLSTKEIKDNDTHVGWRQLCVFLWCTDMHEIII